METDRKRLDQREEEITTTVLELFNEVTEKGRYKVGYLVDGWTKEFNYEFGSPTEAMMITQNILGNICNVTYIEKC